MSADPTTVAITTGGTSVSLAATVNDDGSVKAQVDCNGQKLNATFTGTDILVDIPS